MNNRMQTAIALAFLGVSGAVLSHGASACGIGDLQPSGMARWALQGQQSAHAAIRVEQMQTFAQAVGVQAGTPAQKSQFWMPFIVNNPITGLYHFTFTSQGNDGIPDGVILDQGLTTWHADGTEIMNSGRPPMTQSFCMGAWKQTGRRTYKLNHYALSWDDSGTTFIGPTRIREAVELDQFGSGFHGDFAIDQLDTDGSTVLMHIQGTVDAARLTADSN